MDRPVDYALAYAALGWPVLPLHTMHEVDGLLRCSCAVTDCRTPGKHPRLKNGLLNATTDKTIIANWFRAWSNANIGIVTGAVSGVFALDIDPRHDGDDSLDKIIEQHGPINNDVMAVTGSGGRHFLFKYPGDIGRSTTKLWPGIDTRGDGGYIVVAPSNHASGGAYFWDAESDPLAGAQLADTPQWLLDKLSEKKLSVANATMSKQLTGELYPADEIKRIRRALNYIPANDRDLWLTVGMALNAHAVTDQLFGVWCDWSEQSDKFNLADQRRTWESLKPGKGVNLASVFGLAKQYGYVAPEQSRPPEPPLSAYEDDVKQAAVLPTANQPGIPLKSVLKPIGSETELLERFSLVYAKSGTVFDHQEHILMNLSDMRDACLRPDIYKRWQQSKLRRIVHEQNVGFDPAGEDDNITCNLWSGWPTVPKQGTCDALLGLLYHMCSGEQNAKELATWVIKWLAYPLQHPGAKMRTTLVLHGPQGTGKNLFFEAVMAIYGQYGRIIDQSAIEDKFNDWASKKLFLIADEVVARSDLYHVKNKLKAFITGEWIRVNPKNMAAYEERNHVNLVFLSNERMPVVIEEDDRRHCVIWTPAKKQADYYRDVSVEIKNGGIEALHHWLLNIDLGDFTEHAKPPMTTAKQELLELSKDNILRFFDDWLNHELDGVPVLPVLSDDIYELYKHWCGRQGVKPSPLNRAIDHISKRVGVKKERKRYLSGSKPSNPKFFIYPPECVEKPPDLSESGWLGSCVDNFRVAVKDFRGGASV